MAEFNLSLCSKESLDWHTALTALTSVLASLDQIVPSDIADTLLLRPADLDAVSTAGFVDTDEFYRLRVDVTQELASSLGQTGQTAEAIARLRTLLAWCRRAIGQSAESTLAVANELAAMLLDEGHSQESIDVLDLVVDGLVSKHGARHKSTLIAKGNLATALSNLGTRDAKRKSADMMREILHLGESTFGSQHPFMMTALANLASTLFDLGEYADSEKLYREASVRGKDTDPRFHLNVRGIARALEAQGKVDESRALARRVLSTQDVIQANTAVVLQSLRAQTELNGRMGTVISHDPIRARYTVHVAGKDLSVKRECLRRATCYNPACSAPATSKCGRCESAFYCSQACQRTHWRAHKPACVAI
jgi:tetratricopeptide (TPR) repeat protein